MVPTSDLETDPWVGRDLATVRVARVLASRSSAKAWQGKRLANLGTPGSEPPAAGGFQALLRGTPLGSRSLMAPPEPACRHVTADRLVQK